MSAKRLIGMTIPDGTNQFFSILAQLFQRELGQRQWPLVVMDSDGGRARELANLKLLRSMGIDGLVYICVGDNLEAVHALQEFQCPLLVLDREVPLDNCDFVLTDNDFGVKQSVGYLHSLGHARVACIQGCLNTEPGRERYDAFRMMSDRLGLEVSDDLIFPGDFLYGAGVKAAERMLALPIKKRPTAVFACNDLMAIGAMQKFQEAGLGIPSDISIVGYDDIALSSWVFPKLTTVRQNTYEIAHVGAGLLIERLVNATSAYPLNKRVKNITPMLVERDSCGVPPRRSA